jgi:type II secretory pathway pseudopilin PulG
MIKHRKGQKQRGIALLTVLLFLVLVSALAIGAMFMTDTETQINTNFRREQSAYFAAKSGIEEMRARMMATSPNSIAGLLPTGSASISGNIVYIINEGAQAGSVQPWGTDASKYPDTELCHDGFSGLGSTTVSGIPCALGYGTGTPPIVRTSTLPLNGTSAAVPYKWARVTLKLNNTVQNYPVGSAAATQIVCWNGANEVPLAAGYTLPSDCTNHMFPSANPVYVITAFGTSGKNSSDARKMVQAEVALQPSQPFIWGLFATGGGCGAITMGGGATTDSYTTANGQTYQSSHTNTGGDVGSNGNVLASGSVTIGGAVGSPITPSVVGGCPGAPLTLNGGAGFYKGADDPSGTDKIVSIGTQTIPVPNVPVISPIPPTPKKYASPLAPGNYGDISLQSHDNLTLTSGVYNVNSISLSGQATITIIGAVTLNVYGNGTTPIDLEGGSVTNASGIASNFQINYAGTGTVKVAGGASTYLTVDAPEAAVRLVGNTDIYGSIIANTINDGGGAHFHFDRNTIAPVPSASFYTLLSFRELFY